MRPERVVAGLVGMALLTALMTLPVAGTAQAGQFKAQKVQAGANTTDGETTKTSGPSDSGQSGKAGQQQANQQGKGAATAGSSTSNAQVSASSGPNKPDASYCDDYKSEAHDWCLYAVMNQAPKTQQSKGGSQ
jgi:hypothetical protein